MRITNYNIKTSKVNTPIKIACISDTHGRKCDIIIEKLHTISPDMILLAGDILEVSNIFMNERNKIALSLLESLSGIAPVYYCFGNHEIYYSHSRIYENRIPDNKIQCENIEYIKSLGIHLVNDDFEVVKLNDTDKILVGGLVCGRDMDPESNKKEPDLEFLDKFNREENFKILLCHYPHYYEKYLKDSSFDLIVSGHAHGGQWRLFNQGIYSPHQGLFPKYTSGIHENRFIISRGAVNNSKPIPRFFNPTEILQIGILNN